MAFEKSPLPVQTPSPNKAATQSAPESALTPMSQQPSFVFPTPIIPNTTETARRASNGPPSDEPDYLKLILNARVYDVAIESPLTLATKLSARTGNKIYLKREDLQPIFSFKCRGAYNRMCRLSAQEKMNGVIAVSFLWFLFTPD